MRPSPLVWSLVLLCTLVAIVPAHAARQRPLVERETQALVDLRGAPLGAEAVHDAILRGAYARAWRPIEDTPGRIVLRIDPRGQHTAVVAVLHDDRSFRVEYVSSDNLLYAERGNIAYIHKNYNVWIDNLIQAILLEATRPASLAPPAP